MKGIATKGACFNERGQKRTLKNSKKECEEMAGATVELGNNS